MLETEPPVWDNMMDEAKPLLDEVETSNPVGAVILIFVDRFDPETVKF